jgi:integrase
MELRQKAEGCYLNDKHYDCAAGRTVALDFTALRNVLKSAEDTGHITALPRFPKVDQPPPLLRPLISSAQFDTLLDGCLALKKDGTPVTKNGAQLRDFFRFLADTGGREQESLQVRWPHVDFAGKRLFIGAPADFVASMFTMGSGGATKNHGFRIVDFNPQLESLLEEMRARRAPDSSFLFPSSQRGQKDIAAKSLRDSMNAVRTHVKMENFGFHHLRVFFISYAVMSGIDFMTIARWVGHKDGGVLIGKVYGHIADEHRKKMALKLTIGDAPVPALPTAPAQ